jgi:uncharacterized protein
MMQSARQRILRILSQKQPVLIALSGGTDSSVLLAIAAAAGIPAAAATVISEFTVPDEALAAEDLCRKYRVPWYPVHIEILTEDSLLTGNPENRCYLCKKLIMQKLLALAGEKGYGTVCDGTHAEDLKTGRPGIPALQELSISSPFAEAGIGRGTICELAEDYGVAILPSSACLATRVPFGEKITPEKLKQIAEAEKYLRDQGIRGILRVRVSGTAAVIETEADELKAAQKLSDKVLTFGFTGVTAAEYKTGGAGK